MSHTNNHDRNRRTKVFVELTALIAGTAAIYGLATPFDWFEGLTRWVLAHDVRQLDAMVMASAFLGAGLMVFAVRRWRESELELACHQQAEAARKLLHDELHQRAKQRTAELSTANQALQAEGAEALVQANERTESVLAGIKLSVEALRESEARFRELAENIDEVFWISDPQKSQKLYLSPAFEKIWGRTCQSAYESPLTWLDAVRPEDRDRVRQAAQDRDTRGAFDEEYGIIRPDGTERWIRDRAFPVRDAQGAIKRWVGVAADITDYRLMEEQFRQSQKMEAIGTLAGGIAHDFNNILAAINGYTELSQLILKDNPEVRDHLGAVLKASGRATDLVRQILTFSRQQPLSRRAIQLGPIVRETFALLRATLPSTIEFDVSIEPDAPAVLADASQIHQILMNLGTNAWHAMKERPGRLQVKLERCAFEGGAGTNLPWVRPGSFARVSISDTGCGMDAATRRRIFEPFFTTKPVGEGTGLGLAVVHGIMNSHDGTVRVKSEPGKGTTFQLYFPAYSGEVAVDPRQEAPVPRGQGERVLMVDDEELLARLGSVALSALGYQVEFTTQPATALAMVQADPQRFALVITDQTMPNMTGVALATQLRGIQPALPIIMMTGYSTSLTPERLEAAGVRQLLLKPATLHSLGTAVQAALAAQPLR